MDTVHPNALNLKQAAAQLDVHYMTVYRYVRTGRLPARREGTSWVVEPDDVAAFARTRTTQRTCPADASPPDEWRDRLRHTLVIGDEPAGWHIIEQALIAGYSPIDCYLRLVVGAIDDITNRTSIVETPTAAEYLATATASRIVARLGARFRRPGRSRGTVVFGAALGEHHTLPISVVADLVRIQGLTCLELGADVPPEAFAAAAAGAQRLVTVGIGVTTASNLDAVRTTIAVVHDLDPDIPIVLGGQAVRNPEIAELHGAAGWAPDGYTAIRLIEDLVHARQLDCRSSS